MSETEKIKEHPAKPVGINGEPMFDNRVKIFNEKTGQILAYQPYAMHIFGDSKEQIFERPMGSGNMYNAKGESIGRWEQDKKTGHWKKFADEHIPTKPIPVNVEERLSEELDAANAEIAQLKSELEKRQAAEKRAKKD